MSSNSKRLQEISTKIIIYASEKHKNCDKLLKYLDIARNGRFSKETLGYVEIQLQRKGATQALILYCNRAVRSCQEVNNVGRTELDVLVNALSILGNAFAVNHDAAKEAEKYKLIHTLKILLDTKLYNSESYLLSRAIKCLANLAMYDKLRSKILQEGIAISIIARLEDAYKSLTDNHQITKPSLIEEIIIESADEGIILQASRAIRIFSSTDAKFQQHLVRFGALIAIGRFLKFSFNQDLFSNILKALAFLTIDVKKVSRELSEALTDVESSDRAILQQMIKVLKNRHDVPKLIDPAISCLTQLSMNPVLAKALIANEVFEAVLEAIKNTDEEARLERLLRLLVILTKDSAAAIDGFLSHRLRLCCCSQIGETLKILQKPGMKDFHYWILNLYEQLYEDRLKDLVSRGMIPVLYNFLSKELGEYTLENVRAKIAASDVDFCPVHTEDSQCPFYPQYRCSSPSYTEQEQLRTKEDELPMLMECKLFNDSSPAQSPRGHNLSPVETMSPLYSPCKDLMNKSPTYSSFGSESPPCSSSSDDEGMISTSSPIIASPIEEEEDVEFSDGETNEANPEQDTEEEPANKKARLESIDEPEPSENLTSNQLRIRSNSILSILGILVRCAHFTSFPTEITKFLPFLLETIWNGRLSVEKVPPVLQTPPEQLPLGRLCFQRAYKILYRLCLDINSFPVLIQQQVIPLIHRILIYGLSPAIMLEMTAERRQRITQFLQDYGTKIVDSLLGMNGSQNETNGWREGYFMTVCMTGAEDPNYLNTVLSIPFLYCQFNPTFRKFENVTRNWAAIFKQLTNVDNMNLTQFQTSILALCCIAKTKGLVWRDAASAAKRQLLYQSDTKSSDSIPIPSEEEAAVTFELDDGSKIPVPKQFLLDASPVFAAMFDGHFQESEQQCVKLHRTSKAALTAFIYQIYSQQQYQQQQKQPAEENTTKLTKEEGTKSQSRSRRHCDYQLSTIFELLTLCDQFLLENLYERTLNTLIAFYFCPHSTPKIYHESLQFGGSHREGASNLTLLSLKYLLVGDNIPFTLRSGAFWKIFDATAPSVVVQGLRTLLDYAN